MQGKTISIEQLANLVNGSHVGPMAGDISLERTTVDSRTSSPGAVFIALEGLHHDGHDFIDQARRFGARAIIANRHTIQGRKIQPDWPLVLVDSPEVALQQLAAWYRRELLNRVIVVTGSNGKTVVKDSLAYLLAPLGASSSPGSYNSKIGLPLALLTTEPGTELTIVEVGASTPGRMLGLREIAQPDYGILTNIGMAHFESFGSQQAIANEKMALFEHLPAEGWLLVPDREEKIITTLEHISCPVFFIGRQGQPIVLEYIQPIDGGSLVRLIDHRGRSCETRLNIRAKHIINDIHCAVTAAHLLGVDIEDIGERLATYQPRSTRMESWISPGGVHIINDTYSADPVSVHAALEYSSQERGSGRKLLVFSGMRELGMRSADEHWEVGARAAKHGFDSLYLIDDEVAVVNKTEEAFTQSNPNGFVETLTDPTQLEPKLREKLRSGDMALFKGPRDHALGSIVQELKGRLAQRCLWVNIDAISRNVGRIQRHIGRSRILAVLKASSYGTNIGELPHFITELGIDDIGVSSTTEAIALRKLGVRQKIYVFLPHVEDVYNLADYDLIPLLYSEDLARAFTAALASTGRSLDVHIKVDTGMHRLGLFPEQALRLVDEIASGRNLKLTGVCTQLAAADQAEFDDFTRGQLRAFDEFLAELRRRGPAEELVVHCANTAGMVRFPSAHYDMVRIGIGLYGVAPSALTADGFDFELAVGLTSRVAVVKSCAVGDLVGYNGSFRAPRPMQLAVVPIGYEDGMPWQATPQISVMINGQAAPVVGRISMDQMTVDVTDIEGVAAGTDVLIWGVGRKQSLQPSVFAKQANTSVYETLVRIGQRVQRIYIRDTR